MASNQNQQVSLAGGQQPPAGHQAGPTTQQIPQADPLRIEPIEIKKLMKASLFDATYNAWMNTHFEADKTIIAVSSAGIGLLVTLLSVVEVNSAFEITAYKLALTLFIIAIVSGVAVFKMNGKKLEKMLDQEIRTYILEKPSPLPQPRRWWYFKSEEFLTIMDWVMMVTFFLGVLCTADVGITTYEIKANKLIAEAKKPAERKNVTIDNLQVGSLTIKQLPYSTAKPRRKQNVR